MTGKTAFINKARMKKVNAALRRAGYAPYTGDRTSAHPGGCGSGYVVNLVEYVAGTDQSEQNKVLRIVQSVVEA